MKCNGKYYFTREEHEQTLNSVKFPTGLTFFQQMRVLSWAIFRRQHYWLFIDKIRSGMATRSAYLFTKGYRYLG